MGPISNVKKARKAGIIFHLREWGAEPLTLSSCIPGSPVAFYASFSEGTDALQTVKFNTTYINIGSSYFPEHGYFRASERGVYLFAVSIEFGPGPGTGQLVFGGHRRTPVYTTKEQRGGSPATTFAMAELQKGERVWFELTQGSIMKRSPPGTAFGGFLIFKTWVPGTALTRHCGLIQLTLAWGSGQGWSGDHAVGLALPWKPSAKTTWYLWPPSRRTGSGCFLTMRRTGMLLSGQDLVGGHVNLGLACLPRRHGLDSSSWPYPVFYSFFGVLLLLWLETSI